MGSCVSSSMKSSEDTYADLLYIPESIKKKPTSSPVTDFVLIATVNMSQTFPPMQQIDPPRPPKHSCGHGFKIPLRLSPSFDYSSTALPPLSY